MRLRTLPLSLAGVVLGIFIAASQAAPDLPTVVFLLLTTALLQVVSNLSNELGDTLSGTDTESRSVARYSLQDGDMTVPEMKRLILLMVILCCSSGAAMVYFSTGSLFSQRSLFLLALGACAIVAAMRYTLGHKPYGYRGWGDFYVFVFFGLVSVCGGYYVCTLSTDLSSVILPACGIGCFSVAVLNINNIRDMKTDAATRVTVAMRLGPRNARIYQTMLVCGGWILLALNTFLYGKSPLEWIYLAALPIFVIHLSGVWKKQDGALDPMLPLLVMGTFLLSVLAGTGMVL